MFCSFELFKIKSIAKVDKIPMFPNIFATIYEKIFKLYKNIPF